MSNVCTKFPQFSVFYQYLGSEFNKNTEKSVYLEAPAYIQVSIQVLVLQLRYHDINIILLTIFVRLNLLSMHRKPWCIVNVGL